MKEEKVFVSERDELNQRLINARHNRLESEIHPDDEYWKVREEIQQKLHKLDEVK